MILTFFVPFSFCRMADPYIVAAAKAVISQHIPTARFLKHSTTHTPGYILYYEQVTKVNTTAIQKSLEYLQYRLVSIDTELVNANGNKLTVSFADGPVGPPPKPPCAIEGRTLIKIFIMLALLWTALFAIHKLLFTTWKDYGSFVTELSFHRGFSWLR